MSPVLIGIGAAVTLLSRRSPLVAHRRVGKDGVEFWMLKFRTMWGASQASEHGSCCGLVSYLTGSEHVVPTEKKYIDPRITSRFAAFLRRYSLDELPQLWHVATGRMALVGPRPLLSYELDHYYGHHAREVVGVRPGITGLWQVMGRSRLSYAQRKRLDLFLVRHDSPWLQLRILARTLPQVIRGANAC